MHVRDTRIGLFAIVAASAAAVAVPGFLHVSRASATSPDQAKSRSARRAKEAVKDTRGALSEEQATDLAIYAYIYGYPPVTMEMTRRAMTNAAVAGDKLAPMGQFARLRTYPAPDDKEVTAPNADTLYTTAWLDVS